MTASVGAVPARGYAARFRQRVEQVLRGLEPSPGVDAPLVVAFSGGLDSAVLLHALRFGERGGKALVAAHFDHAMRPDSPRDALWARGVCTAWGVPFRLGWAEAKPPSEDAARRTRYDFLHGVRRETGGSWVLTAHHADDQAETVLFRALRGTGIKGLRGIRARRPPAVARPLLGFWREELVAYAEAVGLRWRDDPTNEHLGFARNVLRHEILPAIEARVAPRARRALVRLAGVAERDEAAWEEVLPRLLADVGYVDGSLDAASVAALGEGVRARVLRGAATLAGRNLDERATRRAVTFAASGRSGTGIELGGGLELRRELDRLVLLYAVDTAATDRPLTIEDPGPGEGVARLGGRIVRVRWCPGVASAPRDGLAGGGVQRAALSIASVAFPLEVRSRRAGDRLGAGGGGRSLKRLFQEARVPSRRRGSVPILSDADGRILWVAGVTETEPPGDGAGESMTITIES